MDEGWDPIMVPHSAAHRGAEDAVLPHAVKRGTSVITFNNTCYGRLLKEANAADCYRFSLAQEGVSLCWTAPTTIEQLQANLEALENPEIASERIAELKEIGARVYREDKTFERCVRAL